MKDKIMARSTTLAVWRSNGGDQTRTTTAGSMVMSVPFYIANVAASANVVVSSSYPNSAVVLPANAIVTDVTVAALGTGKIDLGFTPLSNIGPGQTITAGTAVPAGLLSNASTAARAVFSTGGANTGASLGNVANATNVVVITSAANGVASGTASGFITYFVSDNGQQQD
jgi:hypothetical protein